MSNETGKEIYKEYVNKYFFGDCKNDSQLQELNGQYLILWDENEGSTRGVDYLRRKGYGGYDFIKLKEVEFKYISRAPKTQLINGHEVVAPRYDDDYLTKNNIWVFSPLSIGGVANFIVKINNLGGVEKFGWFDNEKYAIAYANAHRERINKCK